MQSIITVAPASHAVRASSLSASTHFFSDGLHQQTEESRTGAANAPRTDKQKPHALVVDDVQDVNEMIALFLRHAGYEVETASCAMDALEVARREHFDVIVSDIGMPDMNGYELARALRELPHCSTVPLIAVTGFSMYDDDKRSLASGFNAHLTKPINPVDLLDLIERLRD
ncbi:MAG TPA: response regulator [Pyrinomonadaceae bacterium]|jgi:CheY-like chemotaxis protein